MLLSSPRSVEPVATPSPQGRNCCVVPWPSPAEIAGWASFFGAFNWCRGAVDGVAKAPRRTPALLQAPRNSRLKASVVLNAEDLILVSVAISSRWPIRCSACCAHDHAQSANLAHCRGAGSARSVRLSFRAVVPNPRPALKLFQCPKRVRQLELLHARPGP